MYLDHAAATPISKEVLEAMQPFFSQEFGNPSSLHNLGVKANQALNNSRKTVAQILHARPDNIIFTSGGTEANNLAIFGMARPVSPAGHIITAAIEHPSILEPIKILEKQGWDITYVPVDKNGLIKPKEVIEAIRPNTKLISLMYANNEIGTIEPIAQIGRQLLRYRAKHQTTYPYFHTDACQAVSYLNLDVKKLRVDLMSVNASKIYGPKGVGFLYLRSGTKFEPITFGGGQEENLRSGTENLPAIVGLAKALKIAQNNKAKKSARLRELCAYFWLKISALGGKDIWPQVKYNGPAIGNGRLPNNLNVCFDKIDGKTLVLQLNKDGIYCSTGPACNARKLATSKTLSAIGLSSECAKTCLRFTLGAETTKSQIDYTVNKLKLILMRLYDKN